MSLADFRSQYRLCRALLAEKLGNLARCPECDSIYPLYVAFWCKDSEGYESVENSCPCNERLLAA